MWVLVSTQRDKLLGAFFLLLASCLLGRSLNKFKCCAVAHCVVYVCAWTVCAEEDDRDDSLAFGLVLETGIVYPRLSVFAMPLDPPTIARTL